MTALEWSPQSAESFDGRFRSLWRRTAAPLIGGIVSAFLLPLPFVLSHGTSGADQAARWWTVHMLDTTPAITIAAAATFAVLAQAWRLQSMKPETDAERGRWVADLVWNAILATSTTYLIAMLGTEAILASLIAKRGDGQGVQLFATAGIIALVGASAAEAPADAIKAFGAHWRRRNLETLHSCLDDWPRRRVRRVDVVSTFLLVPLVYAALSGLCGLILGGGHRAAFAIIPGVFVLVVLARLMKVALIGAAMPDAPRSLPQRLWTAAGGVVYAALLATSALRVLATRHDTGQLVGGLALLYFAASIVSGVTPSRGDVAPFGPRRIGRAIEHRRLLRRVVRQSQR